METWREAPRATVTTGVRDAYRVAEVSRPHGRPSRKDATSPPLSTPTTDSRYGGSAHAVAAPGSGSATSSALPSDASEMRLARAASTGAASGERSSNTSATDSGPCRISTGQDPSGPAPRSSYGPPALSNPGPAAIAPVERSSTHSRCPRGRPGSSAT